MCLLPGRDGDNSPFVAEEKPLEAADPHHTLRMSVRHKPDQDEALCQIDLLVDGERMASQEEMALAEDMASALERGAVLLVERWVQEPDGPIRVEFADLLTEDAFHAARHVGDPLLP